MYFCMGVQGPCNRKRCGSYSIRVLSLGVVVGSHTTSARMTPAAIAANPRNGSSVTNASISGSPGNGRVDSGRK